MISFDSKWPPFPNVKVTRGHLSFCNANYPKICLCEVVRMDSAEWWPSKLSYKDSCSRSGRPAYPGASTKSNTYRSLFHVEPNQIHTGPYFMWNQIIYIREQYIGCFNLPSTIGSLQNVLYYISDFQSL